MLPVGEMIMAVNFTHSFLRTVVLIFCDDILKSGTIVLYIVSDKKYLRLVLMGYINI